MGRTPAVATPAPAAPDPGATELGQATPRFRPAACCKQGSATALPHALPAAAGHLGVCRAIVEPLKARIRGAEAAGGGAGSPRATAAAAKWRRLLATVLNQRSHKSLTPLMLACEHGHAGVAAYLLREGADPLAADFVHSRTCLHYAAVGGHADCLRLLCSDAAMVPAPDGARPLRDVIGSDVQVGAGCCCWAQHAACARSAVQGGLGGRLEQGCCTGSRSLGWCKWRCKLLRRPVAVPALAQPLRAARSLRRCKPAAAW